MLRVEIRHRFGDFALQAEFEAPLGVTALFGRSGSGKTSVVNAVAGLLRPDAGRIVLGDTVLMDTAQGIFLAPHRRRLGYVFQDARLFPHLNVRQNLGYGRWFAGIKDAPELDRIVDLLGLGGLLARAPGLLSGGERQRVAIGRAILSGPQMLLMDEPLAALDEARKAEILPYLERLRDGLGLPILYVSHAMSEVARLANTLILMDEGRVVRAGDAGEILSDPGLAPGVGVREAGAILTANVGCHEADGLTRMEISAGSVWVPQVAAPPGAEVRLRILAQDVILATSRPEGISALNVLPATIKELRMGAGPGVLVQLMLGQDLVLARVTRRSAGALGLAVGLPVFAVLKAVSVAPESIGRQG